MFEDKLQQLRRYTVLADIVFTSVMLLMSFWLRNKFVQSSADFVSHAALLPLILALWLYSLSSFGAYRSPRITSVLEYGWAIARSVVTGLALLLILLFLFNVHYVSRVVVVLFAVLDGVALFVLRVAGIFYFRRSLRRGENLHKMLIIGAGQRAARLAEVLKENSEWGVDIIGHLDPDPRRVDASLLKSPILGSPNDITEVLKNHVVDEVIVAIPRVMIPDVERIALACEEEGVRLRFMADVFDISVARFSLVELSGVPLLTLEPVAQDQLKLMVKRLFDLVLTMLTLPLVAPLMAVIAIAVKLDSEGPALFVQQRVGLNKRRFPMFKFRTMVQDSEKLQAQLEQMNEAQGPIFKIANDPRITRIGRFLRRTSLDELPQIFNVLRGEMSLVGPRPMSERDVNLFDQGVQRKRFSVKPGLTCLWQVSGRSQLPFSKWLELDLYYIKNWSLMLDFKILCKTVPVVLKGTGAV
jgi:exopolysaccharide biosynthesis polyprenyl glycosylphosphotransferase